jgi:hypothetical protein
MSTKPARTYAKAFDLWQVPDYLRAHIQPGQWVYAGDRSTMGVWLGMRPSGVSVVAWLGNGRRIGWQSYRRTLLTYARAR